MAPSRDWRVRNNVTDQTVAENVTATTRCLRYATPADAGRPSANSDVPLADFDASAYLWRFLNP